MTATRRQRRQRSGWAMTAMRRMIGTLRYVNDELVRASEAMIRSARAPQPRPQASTSTRGAAGRATGAGGGAGSPTDAAVATERSDEAA